MKNALRPMRFLLLLVMMAVLFVVILPSLQRQRPLRPAETPIQWLTTLPASPGQPTLVYFTADWCGPCQSMKSSVWPDEAVVDAAAPYLPVMIDIDAQPELAQRYRIDGIPHIVLLDPAGAELGRQVGYRSADDIAAFLRRHAAQ